MAEKIDTENADTAREQNAGANPLSMEELQEVVDKERFTVLFQPVVSIKSKRVVGFEALSRAMSGDGDQILPGRFLGSGLAPELRQKADRICRKKALESFRQISKKFKELLLFINLSPELLPQESSALGFTDSLVNELGLPPENVCLEISAESVREPQVQPFWEYYRARDYKLSIDHVGTGTDIVDIIASYSPQYLKLGMSILGGRGSSPGAQAKLKLVNEFAWNMNCRLVAFGVEREQEAESSARQGLLLHQGYYYTRGEASGDTGEDPTASFANKIELVHALLSREAQKKVSERRLGFKQYRELAGKVAYSLGNIRPGELGKALQAESGKHPEIISSFVLDDKGRQVTERVQLQGLDKVLTAVDRADLGKGSDHSLQDYYVHMSVEYERYVTAAFISPYTREPSCLVCEKVYSDIARYYILCVELPAI